MSEELVHPTKHQECPAGMLLIANALGLLQSELVYFPPSSQDDRLSHSSERMTSRALHHGIAGHLGKKAERKQAPITVTFSALAINNMPAGHSCCIVGCTSSSHNWKGGKRNNGLSFYRIPKVKTSQGSQVEEMTAMRRRAWIAAIRRPNITFENSSGGMRVCSRHFQSGKSLTVFWPALQQ